MNQAYIRVLPLVELRQEHVGTIQGERHEGKGELPVLLEVLQKERSLQTVQSQDTSGCNLGDTYISRHRLCLH